jgi:chemotaxis protein CheD
MQHLVGISEYKLTDHTQDVMVTYSVSSCLGITLFDPENNIGGMLHSMLPFSELDPVRAEMNPGMFTDTGVSKLIELMVELGADPTNLVAKAAGAARPQGTNLVTEISDRHYQALGQILELHQIPLIAEDIGGTASRNVYLYMEDGKTLVSRDGKQSVLN